MRRVIPQLSTKFQTRNIRLRKEAPKIVTAEEAAGLIQSNERVFFHGVAAFPSTVARELSNRWQELRNVELCHIHIERENPCSESKMRDSFFVNNLFVGHNQREAVASGRSSYIPCFLSEVPSLFRRDILPLDWAVLNVSPPDKHGYCSLGVEVAAALSASQTAKKIIAQVNPNQPRTHGYSHLHINSIDFLIPNVNEELSCATIRPSSEIELRIGHNVASLVQDGACLQMGIGAIPNSVLASLKNHKNLGVHTEMFQDALIDLIESNVVTNSKKTFMPGKTVTSFVMGTKRVYDYVDDNPEIYFMESSITNDPVIIGSNKRTTAINSAIEVDITGQVCADSVGTRHISGVGGQVDFERGAAISENGIPIICLPSTLKNGASCIVPTLHRGAGVTTTRSHVHYVVTEWGCADLFGKNFLERARALINIAHPNHREELERQAYERFKVMHGCDVLRWIVNSFSYQ
ncbi:uncharacterized protein VTP21DRAFT_2594 [Calcarisporiella thermophila]|uniref:uncharacterized protein n=1 Tax=Calcarisporiella thermophila TaxID=911321 RepID=UPI0037423224